MAKRKNISKRLPRPGKVQYLHDRAIYVQKQTHTREELLATREEALTQRLTALGTCDSELALLWYYFCHPCYDHQNAVRCMCKSIPGVPGLSMTGDGPRLSCRGTGRLNGGAKHGVVMPVPVRDGIDRRLRPVAK
ncbi:hypothetical protein B0A55_02884 [Friedmanniomyces simplex]|uniref:Uncharacterized protein n=1 Tax=Friedmanniomyces simplex TaxID=329884 RepID=A0A4U0XNS4_9PEZI|nr:hypothetical protein B0A55_02884 [Friedmanniomyces simplex]